MTAASTSPASAASADEPDMTPREVIKTISGLLIGMFVSILAGTVVSTSLPIIIHDIGGDQTAFTWVVTATLLTTAIFTPIWGKLADLFNRKMLIQTAMIIFVGATAIAGFAQDPGTSRIGSWPTWLLALPSRSGSFVSRELAACGTMPPCSSMTASLRGKRGAPPTPEVPHVRGEPPVAGSGAPAT